MCARKNESPNENKDGKILMQCVACGEFIKCNAENSDTMLQHILKYHPEVVVEENSKSNSKAISQTEESKTSTKPSEPMSDYHEQSFSPGTKTLTKERELTTNSNAVSDYEIEYRRKRYCKYIQKWRFPNGVLYCPMCDIRKRPERKDDCCLLAKTFCCKLLRNTWPFRLCLGEPSQRLSCSNCQRLLGSYNPNEKQVKPRKALVILKNC